MRKAKPIRSARQLVAFAKKFGFSGKLQRKQSTNQHAIYQGGMEDFGAKQLLNELKKLGFVETGVTTAWWVMVIDRGAKTTMSIDFFEDNCLPTVTLSGPKAYATEVKEPLAR